jgi:ADP-ribosylglycohydrolase
VNQPKPANSRCAVNLLITCRSLDSLRELWVELMERTVLNVRDRVEGILLGLAAGDRNGGPIRMAVRLAESLIDRSTFNVADIAARYLDWWHNGAFDTGPTAARVFSLVDAGLTFDAAARQVHKETGEQTAGCNPAHRSAPLAMMPNWDANNLENYAQNEARLTHYHPLSGDVAAAVALICHQLVRGLSWEVALKSSGTGRLPETQNAMAKRRPDALKRGGFSPDVLAAAIHLVENNHTFDGALEASLQFAGPANYCPVLVGSIGGARWGAKCIDQRLLDHCDILPRIRSAAEKLAALWK